MEKSFGNRIILKDNVLSENQNSSLKNEEILEENMLSKIPNPCFKKKEIFSYDNCLWFEIYKLKDINNAFYLAFYLYNDKDIIIYKKLYEKEKFEKISTIKINLTILEKLIIKYFYNPLNKKEYLFVVKSQDVLEIYLIISENKFKLIYKQEDFFDSFEKGRRNLFNNYTIIELFDIIYNKFDNNIYIIISYFIGDYCYAIDSFSYNSNYIKLLTLKNDKLNLIKEFDFKIDYTYKIMNMTYQDKYLKKYYILMLRDDNLQLIEIRQNYNDYQIQNFFKSEIDLQQLKELIKDGSYFNGLIINMPNDNNNDCLYISVEKIKSQKYNDSIKKNFIIIDLLQRKIIKNIKLNIEVCFILNWNNKDLILATNKSLYIFDTRINKIISKYSNLFGGVVYFSALKTLFSLKNNFYSLFAKKEYIHFVTSY